jgi:vacuolar-type H+-ATPase subunit E/Vma4
VNTTQEEHTVPTATKTTENQVHEATERIRDLNERIIDSSRKAGQAYLDSYEKVLKSIADFEERVGSATQVEWVSAVTQAQADFTRDLAKIYTSSARDLLK